MHERMWTNFAHFVITFRGLPAGQDDCFALAS